MSARLTLVCRQCGQGLPFSTQVGGCTRCRSDWLEARYDYAAVGRGLRSRLAEGGRGLWRYRDLLPLQSGENIISLGEGGTPLVPAPNLGLMLSLPRLFVKDERQSPTGSFKDRQAAVAISVLKEAGYTDAVVASTGNVAISYAAYCARAGIKLYAFLTSLVPAEKMRECALYGAQVIKVTSTYDRAKEIARQFAGRKGLHYDRGLRSIAAVESMKTIAFELAEQLAPDGGRWRAPDWYVQSVSGGLGPLGVMKGFRELQQMGLIDRLPRLACIQADGCAPMASAFKRGLSAAEVVAAPRTLIATLSTGDPGSGYGLLKDYIDAHGGTMDSVSDEEAFRAMHVLAKMEGLSMEPAAAVAFAGLIRLARSGRIRPDETVVVNCTGHTMPVPLDVLGEDWAQDVVLQDEAAAAPAAAAPQEGLLAALERLDERIHSIAILDDNPDAARLIRRILQARGNYQLHEAGDGRAGLELIRRQKPDLVVLDLMMPELDGFAVLEALRADEATRDIPVIVVSAKELTPQERSRLSGQIDAWLQKGSFMDDQLLGEILDALT